jgi:hypothetical protein
MIVERRRAQHMWSHPSTGPEKQARAGNVVLCGCLGLRCGQLLDDGGRAAIPHEQGQVIEACHVEILPSRQGTRRAAPNPEVRIRANQ